MLRNSSVATQLAASQEGLSSMDLIGMFKKVREEKKEKSKAVPVTGSGGLLGCESSRLPHYLENRPTDSSDVASVTLRPAGRPLPLERFISVTG
jgi:hypothetical protein